MIDKLRRMAIFASVVDQGTFRAAAQHLGFAPSRVSQAVSDLEKELGVTLLYRSTRRLSLTAEGQILYDKVTQMLQAAETGLDAINLISSQPAGELRVTAPAFITQTGIMDLFAEFSRDYPSVALKFNFSDRPRELIKEGFDVGIRAGWLKDSELMSRKIGEVNRLLVASPDVVADHTEPQHPDDLAEWNWVHFSMRPERAELYTEDGQSVSVACRHRIEVDSAHALYEFAVRGLGLTAIPETLARRGIEHGELVHVLPEWMVRPLEIYAIWPDRSRRESLTLIFARFLAERSDRL
jgi:DNA-binding transcriptional LysR family regulator